MFQGYFEPSTYNIFSTYYIENTYQPISGYHEPIFKTRIKVVGGGGVGIYVRSQYERELCEKLTSIEYKVKHLEFVAIEVSLEDFWKVLIIGIFRPTGKVIHPEYSRVWNKRSPFNKHSP